MTPCYEIPMDREAFPDDFDEIEPRIEPEPALEPQPLPNPEAQPLQKAVVTAKTLSRSKFVRLNHAQSPQGALQNITALANATCSCKASSC